MKNSTKMIDKMPHLVFLDIEATGQRNADIIQISGIKLDLITHRKKEFNQKYYSSQPIPSRVQYLLNFKKNFKNFDKYPLMNKTEAQKIYDFLLNSVIVVYGNFDEVLLRNLFTKYNLDHTKLVYFDISLLFINHHKTTFNLNSLARILKINFSEYNTHSAQYDAWLLENVFFTLLQLPDRHWSDLEQLGLFYPKRSEVFYVFDQNAWNDRKKPTNKAILITDFDVHKKINYVIYDCIKQGIIKRGHINLTQKQTARIHLEMMLKDLKRFPLYTDHRFSVRKWHQLLNEYKLPRQEVKYINLTYLKKDYPYWDSWQLIQKIGHYFYNHQINGTKEYWITC
ncbi:hypothetical protein OF377_03230 [Ureaplasma sp. ES3154-GEN]|uniref:hypothetical protein n=1 Tax=Ureaplasma sp. ES3154-GEN TaxID=2984844 RepID=UPI0021E81A25|nr:hypothetical protein [Ureaplasma sp. ES3154-GEN]MCV3743873.1 hypothetical protein [Ureaplasma sp. ES3154-GEN]